MIRERLYYLEKNITKSEWKYLRETFGITPEMNAIPESQYKTLKWEARRWYRREDKIPYDKQFFDLYSLKDGDIVLFHLGGFSPISYGIRELTQSYWNHAGLFIWGEDGEGYVIEALGKVVQTPIKTYIRDKRYNMKAVRVKQSAYKDEANYKTGITIAILRMKQAIGRRYDVGAIFFLAIKYIFRAKWIRKNPCQDREEFFCSEVICESFYGTSSIVLALFEGKTKQTCGVTTPKDLGKSEYVEFITGTQEQ